ncbi:ribosomal protein S18 acetylase RimI-like enzyme [Friedmanniella endophytica]|uniref:Ribosomal protein S18 acetylase RimI-like enzyme n=1 Tax=Microlunatus kandeliicorticis TaxID=1759536 RepID=A0A7W3IU81_9ACTN|nr:GNAT family N-acetyltransferase [Microlunatus kandeliicorticis]MBA8795353.1 ribosomal protein S18 acetylase RimI-like enzyme [Microlunatus kandeliicorticis]
MTEDRLAFGTATADEVEEVLALVRSAYRGEASRAGWTTEADLLDDERIDAPGVAAKISTPGSSVLTARTPDGELVGCCELVLSAGAPAYFGMFAVSPTRQNARIGRRLLAHAEALAAGAGADAVEMTVIRQRTDIIDWYARRGYAPTGEVRPFPYAELVNGRALRDDLAFLVLRKPLHGSAEGGR